LQQRLSKRDDLNWEDFLPASIESLLRHYRLHEEALEGSRLDEVAGQSAITLLQEEGIDATVERLACLPVRMPDELASALKELEEDRRHALFQNLLSNWDSIVSLLNLVDLILRSTEASDWRREIVRVALDRLFSDNDGEKSFRLFKEILDFASDEFGYKYRGETVPSKAKLAMIWAHTSRLQNIFHSAGAASDAVEESFREHRRQMSTELISREPSYWNDVLHPRRANRTKLLTHGLAKLLGDKDAQTLSDIGVSDLIRRRVFEGDTDGKQPRPELILSSAFKIDQLGSFLGGDTVSALAPIIGTDGLETLSTEAVKGLIQRALDMLKENPTGQTEWGILFVFLGDSSIDPNLQESLQGVLQAVDIDAIYDVDPAAARLALLVSAKQLPPACDDSLRSRLEASFLRAIAMDLRRNESDHRALPEGSGGGGAALIDEAFDIAFWISVRPNDPGATSIALGQLLRKMLTALPKLAKEYRHLIWQLISELPVSQIRGLWPVLLHVRASSREPL
jgi:hypothetical protein